MQIGFVFCFATLVLMAASTQGLNHPAVVGEIPYIVAIWQVMDSDVQAGNETDFQCTGVLVTNQHVLTTITCIDQSKRGYGAVVSAGFVNRASTPDIRFHQIVEVARHEDFDVVTRENDVAILTVDPPFQNDPNVLPVSLASSKALPGIACTVSGWRLSFFYTSDELRIDQVQVLPDGDCANLTTSLAEQPVLNADDKLFFGGEKLCVDIEGSPECIVGDEGGPLVCGGKLAGLFSSYGLVCLGTSPEPSLYHDVDHYADWIYRHTGNAASSFVTPSFGVLVLATLSVYWTAT